MGEPIIAGEIEVRHGSPVARHFAIMKKKLMHEIKAFGAVTHGSVSHRTGLAWGGAAPLVHIGHQVLTHMSAWLLVLIL